MARKGTTISRQIMPDPVYKNPLVAKFISRMMKNGKRQLAQRIVYSTFGLLEKKLKKNPLEVFLQAIDNIRPQTEIRARRVGGAAYQVPRLVRGKRQETLALRWLTFSARARSNREYHTFVEKLAAEIIDAYNKTGMAISKRGEMEKIAEANRAFAHLRW